MSLEKSEVKASTINEVGNKLEDKLEAAKAEMSEAKGIRAGFDFVLRRMEQLTLALDGDVKVDPPKVTEEEYKVAKKYLSIVSQHLQEMIKNATDQVLRMQGKVAALDQTVQLVGGMLKVEEGKVAAIRSGALVSEDSGQLPGPSPSDAPVLPLRQPGTHPGNPIAALHARGLEPPQPPKKRGRRKKHAPDA